MAILLSVCLGLGLSAACGFRIFVPFLVMSVASRADHLDLSARFDWISSDAALITFGVAAVVEIAAYYVPWVDNILDAAATPVAVIAGVVATAATVQDMSPLMTWTLAVIGGGGVAGVIQTGTALLARGVERDDRWLWQPCAFHSRGGRCLRPRVSGGRGAGVRRPSGAHVDLEDGAAQRAEP